MEAIIFFIIFFLIALSTFIKKVPANTVIIVDRNTHYLKTKKSGFYFFNPSTDKVTTQISRNKIFKTYSNFFETHDGQLVHVNFSVLYHASDLDDVLAALSSVRRSIDDVMNGSVYWAVNDLSLADFLQTSIVLKNEIRPKLLSEAQELKIIIDEFQITGITKSPVTSNIKPFKPHLNSHSQGPIKFN